MTPAPQRAVRGCCFAHCQPCFVRAVTRGQTFRITSLPTRAIFSMGQCYPTLAVLGLARMGKPVADRMLWNVGTLLADAVKQAPPAIGRRRNRRHQPEEAAS